MRFDLTTTSVFTRAATGAQAHAARAVMTRLTTIVLAGGLGLLPAMVAHAGQNPAYSTNTADQEAQRKQYAEKVSKSYNFAFGKGKI